MENKLRRCVGWKIRILRFSRLQGSGCQESRGFLLVCWLLDLWVMPGCLPDIYGHIQEPLKFRSPFDAWYGFNDFLQNQPTSDK